MPAAWRFLGLQRLPKEPSQQRRRRPERAIAKHQNPGHPEDPQRDQERELLTGLVNPEDRERRGGGVHNRGDPKRPAEGKNRRIPVDHPHQVPPLALSQVTFRALRTEDSASLQKNISTLAGKLERIAVAQ